MEKSISKTFKLDDDTNNCGFAAWAFLHSGNPKVAHVPGTGFVAVVPPFETQLKTTVKAMDAKSELYKKVCISHSKEKCLERYRIQLTDQDIESMVQAVQNNESFALPYGYTNNRAMHWIKVRDQFVLAVYDKALKTLATILPPNSKQLRPQVAK